MSASVPEVHDIVAQLLELLGVRRLTGSLTLHCSEGAFLKYHVETFGKPPRDTRACRKPSVDSEPD